MALPLEPDDCCPGDCVITPFEVELGVQPPIDGYCSCDFLLEVKTREGELVFRAKIAAEDKHLAVRLSDFLARSGADVWFQMTPVD